jgi:hypothetical protein
MKSMTFAVSAVPCLLLAVACAADRPEPRLAAPTAGLSLAESSYPAAATRGDVVDEVPRREGRGSLSLARGARLAADPRVDRSGERGDVRALDLGEIDRASEAREAPRRAVELRALHACRRRTARATSSPRTTDCRTQSVVYYVDGPRRRRAKVLLDPNTLSKDGTVALGGLDGVRRTGRWYAYGVADGGSDWTTWRVRDVEKGARPRRHDPLDQVQHAGVAARTARACLLRALRGARARRRSSRRRTRTSASTTTRSSPTKRRTCSSTSAPINAQWGFSGEVSDDGALPGAQRRARAPIRSNRVFYKDARADGRARRRVEDRAAAGRLRRELRRSSATRGSTFCLYLTNLAASRQRVIAIDVAKPERANWKRDRSRRRAETLQSVSLVGDGSCATTWRTRTRRC